MAAATECFSVLLSAAGWMVMLGGGSWGVFLEGNCYLGLCGGKCAEVKIFGRGCCFWNVLSESMVGDVESRVSNLHHTYL